MKAWKSFSHINTNTGSLLEAETADDPRKIAEAKTLIDRVIRTIHTTDGRRALWTLLFDVNSPDDTKSPNALARINVKFEFKSFLDRRESEKRSLYRSIVLLGFWITLASILFFFFGFGLAAVSIRGDASYTLDAIYILSAFGSVLGVIIYSTVPTSEFDIFDFMSDPNNRLTKILISFVFGIVMVCGPVLYTSLVVGDDKLAYVSYIVIPIGVYMFFNIRESVTYELLAYQFLLITLLIPFLWGIHQFVWGRSCDWQMYTSFSIFIVDGLSAAIAVLHIYVYVRKHKDKGWGADAFNACIHLFLVAIGLNYLIFGYCAFLTGESYDVYLTQYICGVADLIPILLLVYLTPSKAFTVMARLFEKDLDRLYNDGSFMAALVQIADTRNSDQGIIWKHRKRQFILMGAHVNDSDQIDRSYWMKAHYEDATKSALISPFDMEDSAAISSKVSKNQRVKASISYANDLEYSWGMKFEGSKLVSTDPRFADPSKEWPRPKFLEWIGDNFDDHNDGEDSSVYYHNNDVDEVCWYADVGNLSGYDVEYLKCKRIELREYAIEHLREYQWVSKEHIQELLRKSPREIGDNEAKQIVYQMSTKVNAKNRKIDFFISHSWSDNAEWKINALEIVAENFKKTNGRYPTFWFDKVCIDQQDAGKGIAVLPINIGACERVLVLLGATYMKRLWCIWELFTLFVFCNRELALERICVVPLGNVDVDQELKCFSINAAHCFDPNEEFKLRHLMIDVIGQGGTDVEKAIKDLHLHGSGKLLLDDQTYYCFHLSALRQAFMHSNTAKIYHSSGQSSEIV